MNKQQALERLSAIETETKELRKIIDAPEKPSAHEFLTNWLNENLRAKLGEDRIIWYRGDQWIFDLDLNNKYFWCYYYEFWEELNKEYSLPYERIREVVKDVLLKPFICEGFTPHSPKGLIT